MKITLWMMAAFRLVALLFVVSDMSSAALADGNPGADVVLATTQGNIRVRQFLAPGKQRRPAVLLFHGSGPVDHDAVSYSIYTKALAAFGIDAYVVFYYNDSDTKLMTSPDHGVRSKTYESRFPAWVQESREVISFVLSRPESNGKVALMGFSNGATLSVGVAALDPRVLAVAEFYGALPPMTVKRLPPLLIQHGTADQVIPLVAAQELAAKAKSLGVPAEMILYPGLPHVFDLSAKGEDARQRALQFLVTHFR